MDKAPIEIAIGQTNILIEDEVCKAVGRVGIHINKEELLKALKAYEFVEELTNYIFTYPDDDYMTMECRCRKLVKHGLLDKADGYYQTHEIRTNTHECVKNMHDKTEPTISKMEQVDKDINVRSKDEPQTQTEIAKAIVHKMIDDAVIAEDVYPDLRQKMHDAVDEYEPQTDCAWK